MKEIKGMKEIIYYTKVRCLNNKDQNKYLTINKIYDAYIYVDPTFDEYYRITSDLNDSGGYFKSRFKELTIKEIRTIKLEKLNESKLNESNLY